MAKTPTLLADVVFDAPKHRQELISIKFKTGDVLLDLAGDVFDAGKESELTFPEGIQHFALDLDLIDRGAVADQLEVTEVDLHIAITT